MTTSADPRKLETFVTGVKSGRSSAETEQRGVAAASTRVTAACEGFVTVPAIAALATLLESMGENETFVTTIRTELEAADTSNSGVVTISDASVAAALASKGVGTPPTPVTFDPLTVVGIPQTSGFVDDPICAANGNMIHQDVDIEFPAIAGALDLGRTYNSLMHERIGAFGPGWSSVLDVTAARLGRSVAVQLPDGAIVTATPSNGGWNTNSRRIRRFEAHDDGAGFTVHLDHVRRLRFDDDGLLTGWEASDGIVDVERVDGRVVAASERHSGRRLEIDWDDDLIAAVTSDDGRTVTYQRDGLGRLTTVSTHCGSLHYTWENGLLLSVTDSDGVAAFLNVYDETGRVVEQTSPFGRVTAYRYDDATGATVISDQRGVRQAMVHDGRGNLTSVVDTDGSAMRITYDDADRAVKVVAKSGAAWGYDFDADTGDLLRRRDPDGLSQSWEWDELGRVVTDTGRDGSVTTFEYQGTHRNPVRIVGPLGAVSTTELNEVGLAISVTDADGVVTRLSWDTDGQLVGILDAVGSSTSFGFDRSGLLRSVSDPAQLETRLDYVAGRVSRTERGAAITSYERTAAGRIRGGIEAGGEGWTATFGDHGALEAITDALGSTVGFEYDVLGNTIAVTAPDGAVYRSEFDLIGRHVASSDPTGATSRLGYDLDGTLVEVVDPDGRVMRRTVDAFGRTLESIAPDGGTTRWTYHPDGEIATVTGPDGRVWTTEVDGAGRVVAVTDPAGGTATRSYSPAGRLLSRTSPAGRTERFEYDVAGRCTAVVGADGIRRAMELDERAQVSSIETSIADRTATAIEVAGDHLDVLWDDEGRIVGYRSSGGTSHIERDAAGRIVATQDETGVSSRFVWDARGLLQRAFDGSGAETSYRYDERGRQVAQTTPGGRTTHWSYDTAGFIGSVTEPAGETTDVVRDASGLITGVRRVGGGWNRTLDAAGREIERRAADGQVLGRYTYDVAGRIDRADVPDTGVFTEFLWDDNDRLTAFTDSTGTNTLERDADGWVTAFTSQTGERTVVERDVFGHVVGLFDEQAGEYRRADDDVVRDPAGRLLIGPDGTVYRYDDAGRLAEIAPPDDVPTRYEYGVDGLVTRETGPAGDRRFGYDIAGRVVEITVLGLGTTTIGYDANGRRQVESNTDGTTTRYGWNDLDQLVEITRAETDGATTTTRLELDALGRPSRINDQPVGYDALVGRPNLIGDVRLITAGSLTWRSDDPTWQRTRADRVDGIPVGGLMLLGARVYDPTTRQFLTTDPLMSVPGSNGSASGYTYAWQDPVNFVDPTGLTPVSKEAYDAIRQREEQGNLGQAWQAIKDDPWGSVAMGLVVVAGVGLMFVPGGQVIGAGILIGAATSAGIGVATGTFDPRQVAFSGLMGGVSGGAGALTSSAGAAVASGALLGGTGDLGSQMISGGPIDWGSVATSTGLGALTAGIGSKLNPPGPPGMIPPTPTIRSTAAATVQGATLDGGSEIIKQTLTGDHKVDLNSVAITAAGGGLSGANGHVNSPDPVPGVGPRVTIHAGGDGGSTPTGGGGQPATQPAIGPGRPAPLAIGPGRPPQLAIGPGHAPPLAIEAGRSPLAIEAPRPRLQIEPPPARLALTAGTGG